jgi:hypothetical protein
MAILVFLSVLRLLFYFGFSSKLALVLDVIDNAKIDILLFIIMLFFIIISFCLLGVSLFGFQNPQTNNISKMIIL